MKVIGKIILKGFLVVFALFAVTFTVYFFNLDMKATAMLAPLLEKWYDSRPHDQYV